MKVGYRFAAPVIHIVKPAAPSVTPTGGAAGAYGYKIVCRTSGGSTTAPTSEGTTAVGPTTLDETHYNTVAWDAATGTNAAGTTYDVYRTTGGATQGLIASGLTDRTLEDNGLVATGTTPTASVTLALDPFDAVYVGTGGLVTVVGADGASVTMTGSAGKTLPLAGVIVDLTSTADDMVVLRR